MQERIVISGLGIVSALGATREEQLRALRAGVSGVGRAQFLPTVHRDDFYFGEVSEPNETLRERIGAAQYPGPLTRTTLLMLRALRNLFTDYGDPGSGRLAFVNATTVGGMCEVERYYPSYVTPGTPPEHPEFVDTLDCGECTTHFNRFFNLKATETTISTACSSSANSILLGARLLRNGLADTAICGGTDALSRFTHNGFSSLKNVDTDYCKPFDGQRNGLNLGEGAAYVRLERESDALRNGHPAIAVLSGYANTNDAHHPTAPAPDGSGALRTMQQALGRAGLSARELSYINAHGTATLNNDEAEGRAIGSLGDAFPIPFISTKPFTGHTLAAAGAIEAVFSLWSIEHQEIYPSLRFRTPMEGLSVRPNTEYRKMAVRHVLSNSFGFGGSNVSLLFSQA